MNEWLRAARSRAREHRLLCLILLAGFALRIAPILWGVPLRPEIQDFHPDESKVYLAVARFPEIYGTTQPFPGYGTAVQYLLGTLLLPLKAVVVGLAERPYAYRILAQLASRMTSVLLGAGCIPLLYVLGARLFDRATATTAAALLAVSFFHAMNSAVGTLDVPLSFLVMVNVLVCFRVVERPRPAGFALVGICTGLVVGTKVTGIVFVVVPATLLLVRRLPGTGAVHGSEVVARVRVRDLAAYAGCALAAWAVTNPQVLVALDEYVAWWIKEGEEVHSRNLGSVGDLVRTWTSATTHAVGWPVAILAVVGAFLAGRKRRAEKLALLAFVFVYYAVLQWSLLARYVIAVAPILCLFAARGAWIVVDLRRPWARQAGVAVVAISVLAGLHGCVWGVYLRWSDTRPEATRFLEANVARGATVGLAAAAEPLSARTHRWRYPKVDFQLYAETSPLERPEILVFSSADYRAVLDTLRSGRLGPDYAVPAELSREWFRYRAPTVEAFRLYDEVLIQEKGYRLLAAFRVDVPVPLEFPPPEVRIYARRTSEEGR